MYHSSDKQQPSILLRFDCISFTIFQQHITLRTKINEPVAWFGNLLDCVHLIGRVRTERERERETTMTMTCPLRKRHNVKATPTITIEHIILRWMFGWPGVSFVDEIRWILKIVTINLWWALRITISFAHLLLARSQSVILNASTLCVLCSNKPIESQKLRRPLLSSSQTWQLYYCLETLLCHKRRW